MPIAVKITLSLLFGFVILILWLFIDYTLGTKKHVAFTKKRTSTVRNSNIHLFTSGPELFNDLFAACRNAQSHIHISFYIVKNDAISSEFLAVLNEKAAAGVEVRLLLDWVGGFRVSRKKLNELRKNGGHFSFSHLPKFPYYFHSLQVRNHRKIAVIDGKVGFMGGYNVGKEYMNEDPKLSPWRDYHLKIAGEGALDLQKVFLLDWCTATKEHLPENEIYFPTQKKGACSHQIVPSQGISIEDAYSTLIQEAKQSIFIGTPYFIPSKRLLHDLLAALKRGVHLTIVVPYDADHLLVKEASFPFLRKLIKNGANVYEYINGFYHAKIIFVDGTVCDIGTANFDKRSLFINYEINCYVYDHEFLRDVRDVIQTDVDHSQRLTLEKLNNKKRFQPIWEWVATAFSHFL